MKRLIAQRHTVRHNIVAIVCVCLSFYFMGNVLFGERSSFQLVSLNQQITTIGGDVASLETARTALESKVVRLRPGSIDPDMLEERARIVLGFQHANERALIE